MFEQKGNLQDDRKDKPSGENPPPEDMDEGDVFCNSEEDDKDDEAQNETTTLETDCNEATPESKESKTPTPEAIPETKETKNSTPEAEKEKPKDTKEEDKKHEEDKIDLLFGNLDGKLNKMNTNQEAMMVSILGMNQRMSTIEQNQRDSNNMIFKTIGENHNLIMKNFQISMIK